MKTMKKIGIQTWAVLGCLMLFGLVPVTAVHAEGKPVGKVLLASGEVTAVDSNGEHRVLKRRSKVFVGDTLKTGLESQVQLRMKDGAILAIGANAEFIVKSYSYKAKGDAKDEAVMTLVKGGLRTITGKIDKGGYTMETSVSTLGIRGTVYDVYISPVDGSVTVFVHDGEVVMDELVLAKGLAALVFPGGQPKLTTPEEIKAALDYLRGMLPVVPDNIMWDEGATFVADDMVINIINEQPPVIQSESEDGQPQHTPVDPCLVNPESCAPPEPEPEPEPEPLPPPPPPQDCEECCTFCDF